MGGPFLLLYIPSPLWGEGRVRGVSVLSTQSFFLDCEGRSIKVPGFKFKVQSSPILFTDPSVSPFGKGGFSPLPPLKKGD